MNDQSRLFKGIRALQYLSGAETVILRFIGLHICYGTGFVSPGMVDQKLCVYTEKLIQQIFIMKILRLPDRASGHITHGVHSILCQLPGIAPSYTPEIGDRLMSPKLLPVAPLCQLCDPHTICVRCHMLGHNIHGDLAQIHIGADPCCSRDTGVSKYIPDHGHGKLMGCHTVCWQISGHINKYLINGIHMDILRCHIFQINIIDSRAVLHIPCHLRRCHDIIYGKLRMCFQLICKV